MNAVNLPGDVYLVAHLAATANGQEVAVWVAGAIRYQALVAVSGSAVRGSGSGPEVALLRQIATLDRARGRGRTGYRTIARRLGIPERAARRLRNQIDNATRTDD